MSSRPEITICTPEGEVLNGLGMMMLQYLEQNLAEFEHKVQQGLSIRGRVSVEVEKGIAITACFEGERIQIENGVCDDPDLFLRSSYITLSEVLSGKARLFQELLKGNVRLGTLPRRPVQSLKMLRFLRIPPELLLDRAPPSQRRRIVLGAVLGAAVVSLMIYLSMVFL